MVRAVDLSNAIDIYTSPPEACELFIPILQRRINSRKEVYLASLKIV